MASRRLLEVCVDSPAGLMAAIGAGADRIELCSALALSGLTPSPGLIALAAKQAVPSYPMIRPHPGEFRYDALDLDVMRGDIDAVCAAGLAGVVIGANRAAGDLDEDMIGRLVDHARPLGLGLTLHRAFDLVPDFERALEIAIAFGFERVLTSGGARTAILGAGRIADLVAQAETRITIMAGCGVNPGNVAELVARTGVREVHGSFGGPVYAPGGDQTATAAAVELGFVQAGLKDTVSAAVAAAAKALKGLD